MQLYLLSYTIQEKSLSIDLETKILNDLDDNFVRLTSMAMEKHQLMKVVTKQINPSSDIAFSYHILYTFAHAFHMHQRKVVSDNEWGMDKMDKIIF